MSRAKRAWWIFMVALFAFTSVGVGIYAFYQNTHSKNNSTDNYISCSSKKNKEVFSMTNSNGTLKGTKLKDFEPVKSVAYVSCTDFTVGTGETATKTSTITADYTGALAATGDIFESSLDSGQPLTIGLDQVIPGWTEGIAGMKVGGERRVLIPAQYAYGAQALPGIPANSDLVFDVKLISVK